MTCFGGRKRTRNITEMCQHIKTALCCFYCMWKRGCEPCLSPSIRNASKHSAIELVPRYFFSNGLHIIQALHFQ